MTARPSSDQTRFLRRKAWMFPFRPVARTLLGVCFSVALAAALRLPYFTTRSIWFDEAASWQQARWPAKELFHRLRFDTVLPPFFLLLKGWMAACPTGRSGCSIAFRMVRCRAMQDRYEPAWRRPIANVFRRTAHSAVRLCVRWNIHPNYVSYASIAASSAAGVCFWRASELPALLILGVGFCYVRLWLNMLDGMVALASGKASRIGEIVNELPDRVSDVVIFVGVAHSGLCHMLGGYWAAIFALLVAYVGILGQAVGVQREFSGLMTKPWRMVALNVGAWWTLAVLWRSGDIHLGRLTILDWTHLVIVAGCLQTIWVRLARIARALRTDDGPRGRP